MSFYGGMQGIATGPGSAMRFASTRGRIQGAASNGMNYPSPFFDVAATYLPPTMKALLRWCRYYFLTGTLTNAAVFKLSEYPVTDIIIEHEDQEVVKRWTEYFQEHLHYRSFQVEAGLDYHCFGNSFVGLNYQLLKWLKCTNCGFSERADKIKNHYVFTNHEFRLNCPQCFHVGSAEVRQQFLKNASGIKLLRWNPEDIEIDYNQATGNTTYYYSIPQSIRSDITVGKKDVVADIPQIFIQAVKENKGIVLNSSKLFHLKRPSLATTDRGWGIPLLLPVLKDSFYLQVMKKAQESILLEHIIPLRTIFPQAATGSSDPFCVSPETLVETVDGVMPAAEVGEGDYLRSHTGAWRRVNGRISRAVPEDEKTYKFTISSIPGFPFVVSEEHPLLAVPRTQRRHRGRQCWTDPEFMQAQKLKVGDFVAYPVSRTKSSAAFVDLGEYTERAVTEQYVYRRLSQGAAEIYEYLEEHGDPKFGWGERQALLRQHSWNESDFAVAHTMRTEPSVDRMPRLLPIGRELAVLIGYYLAEGCTSSGTPHFGLHEREEYIAEEIELAATALGFRQTSRHLRPKQRAMEVVAEDVLLGEFLERACGKYAVNKKIPQFISEASDHVVLETLRCLFNGDGSDFHTGTNRVALKTVSPNLAVEARRLMLSFGLIGCVSREVMDEHDLAVQDAFHLNFSGPQADGG